MNNPLLILALFMFLALWLWAIRQPSSWQLLLKQTIAQRDIEPLYLELQRKPELVQPRFFDEAMKYLMQTDLLLATQLTLRFVPLLPDNKLSQYWLEYMHSQQETSVHFSSEFLEKYRRTNCATGAG